MCEGLKPETAGFRPNQMKVEEKGLRPNQTPPPPSSPTPSSDQATEKD